MKMDLEYYKRTRRQLENKVLALREVEPAEDLILVVWTLCAEINELRDKEQGNVATNPYI